MQPAFAPALGAPRAKHATYVGLRPSTCALPARRVQVSRTAPTAKLFDWKQRADTNHAVIPEEDDGLYKLHNLKPAPGSRHRKKRKGRGHAAGQGGSCGFGMRGQKSRSGRSVRPGFEGGQTPLYRRIPKFVGRPMGPGHKKKEYALIKLDHLNECEEGAVVTMSGLRDDGVVTKQKLRICKVVGGADLTVKGLTVRAHAFTQTARSSIIDMGGKCVLISPTTGKDLEGDDADVAEQVVTEDEAASDVEDQPE